MGKSKKYLAKSPLLFTTKIPLWPIAEKIAAGAIKAKKSACDYCKKICPFFVTIQSKTAMISGCTMPRVVGGYVPIIKDS